MAETNTSRRGVPFPTQSPDVKDKIKAANQANLGVDWPQQSLICQQKSQETSLKIYGVRHACQNPEYFANLQKRSYLRKEFEMPSGDIRIVQGYEPFALDELIKSGIDESDILTGANVPSIPYKDKDGKDHIYHPDIFIKNQNKIIEVKSDWTYSCKTDNIQLKAIAARAAGYNYEVWIYNGKGKRVENTIEIVDE
jgi:hypothetical protein